MPRYMLIVDASIVLGSHRLIVEGQVGESELVTVWHLSQSFLAEPKRLPGFIQSYAHDVPA